MIIAILMLLLASCSHPAPAPVVASPPPPAIVEPAPIGAPKPSEPLSVHRKVQLLQYQLGYLKGLKRQAPPGYP